MDARADPAQLPNLKAEDIEAALRYAVDVLKQEWVYPLPT